LYNLQEDIGERKDVKDQHPEIVEQLKALAEKARSDLGDSLTKRKGTHVREPGSLPPQKKI
jgi:arylsulfatase